jgi:hypothetical protein
VIAFQIESKRTNNAVQRQRNYCYVCVAERSKNNGRPGISSQGARLWSIRRNLTSGWKYACVCHDSVSERVDEIVYGSVGVTRRQWRKVKPKLQQLQD